MKTKTRIALAAAVLALGAPAISATLSAPVAVPLSRQIPDAADVPYPGGTMKLHIDATDITRGAYRVTQTVPVAPGTKRLTLMLPQWLPGNHGPRGPMAELVDIHFFAGDRKLSWKRDPVEVYAFHIDVPAGAKDVTAKYIHTSPLQSAEGRITMTQEMLNLQWEKMSLYPAGHYVRQIKVVPSVTRCRCGSICSGLALSCSGLSATTFSVTFWPRSHLRKYFPAKIGESTRISYVVASQVRVLPSCLRPSSATAAVQPCGMVTEGTTLIWRT